VSCHRAPPPKKAPQVAAPVGGKTTPTAAVKTTAAPVKDPAIQKRLAEYRAGAMKKRLASWKPHHVTPLKITTGFWFTPRK
jgi:hypothetical protein